MERRKTRSLNFTTYVAALAAGAAIWQLAASQTNPAFLASFTATIGSIYEMLQSGLLTNALLSSLLVYLTGLSAAIVVGIGVGLLLARVRLLRVALESYIMLLYATPMVALIPFVLSMMGFGFAPKALVVFLFAVFSVLYNTIEGARSLRPEMLEVARSFRSGEWGVWRDVLIPYTLPYALTGVRQGIGRGLVGLVAGEFFLSGSGIGLLIMRSERDFDVPGLYGSILVITILGAALMGIGRALENHFAAWRGLDR
ncbi:MAG TPA: ABC transporter permease [Xanthobacteraceae bacterium]|jgi:NitT/TauT family transport system permease protein